MYCRGGYLEESFEGDSQKLRQVTKWGVEWLSCLVKYTYCRIGHVRKSFEGRLSKIKASNQMMFRIAFPQTSQTRCNI